MTATARSDGGRTGRTTARDERATLRRLAGEGLEHARALGADAAALHYLESHVATEIVLDRQLRVLDQILPYVRGRVLEWGCRHALDSCVYRMRFGDTVELLGCDVCEGDEYRPFHDFARLAYTRLNHPWRLPYDSDAFDLVTSNGVLEHVPDDVRSLEEIHRVLKPGGTLVITCLPNRWSWTEALQRRRGVTSHDRLYTTAQAREMLTDAGFRVRSARRFLMVPTMLHGLPGGLRNAWSRARRVVWAADAVLERVPLLNRLASNLLIVADKPSVDRPRG